MQEVDENVEQKRITKETQISNLMNWIQFGVINEFWQDLLVCKFLRTNFANLSFENRNPKELCVEMWNHVRLIWVFVSFGMITNKSN